MILVIFCFRFVNLVRDEKEVYINAYNPAILMANSGNMDIEYIQHGSFNLISYITKYLTKNDQLSDRVADALNRGVVEKNASIKLAAEMMRSKLRGLPECVDLLLGQKLYGFGFATIFINTDLSESRVRVLKSVKEIQDSGLRDDEDAFQLNVYDHYYPHRPREMEKVSLFSFMISFEVVNEDRGKKMLKDDGDDGDDCGITGDTFAYTKYHYDDSSSPFYNFPELEKGYKLKIPRKVGGQMIHSNRVIKKLGRQKVPQVYLRGWRADDPEEHEDFYRRLCVLFVPWRVATRFNSLFMNYEEYFKNYLEKKRIVAPAFVADVEEFIKGHVEFYKFQSEAMNALNKKVFILSHSCVNILKFRMRKCVKMFFEKQIVFCFQ